MAEMYFILQDSFLSSPLVIFIIWNNIKGLKEKRFLLRDRAALESRNELNIIAIMSNLEMEEHGTDLLS